MTVPAVKVLYVKTHLANFREGAGTGRRILRVLRQGARLEILEERSDWFRVRLDDGQEGWVAASVTSAAPP
jgi:SH3-like domain-containing protein